MASPTFDETYNDLVAICKAAQSALYDCGRLRGRNDLTSDEEPRRLVLTTSKAILNRLPCLQLECDAIEHEDSRYGAILTRLENAEGEEDPEALSCQDQADKGLCGECIESCDVTDGEPEEEELPPIFARIGKVRSDPTPPGKEAEREEISKAADMLFRMLWLNSDEPEEEEDEEDVFAAAKALMSLIYSDDEKKLSEEIAKLEKAHAEALLHPEERLKTTAQILAENPDSPVVVERHLLITKFMNALDAKIDAYFGKGAGPCTQ